MSTDITNAVRSCLIQNEIYDCHVLIAVSGGVDSVTLTHVVNALSDQLRLTLSIVHVNHGLRGLHSDADEQFVRELAAQLSIDCYVERIATAESTDVHSLGIEATARNQRYAFCDTIVRRKDARALLTAHNLEDNIETFVMNAARGSGYRGLSGIPEMRGFTPASVLIRPFLACHRDAIRTYANNHGLSWRNDHTNDTLEFTRNRVRHLVLPALTEALGPVALDGIHTSIKHLSNLRSVVDVAVKPYASFFTVCDRPYGSVTEVLVEALHDISEELVHVLLVHYLGLGSDDVARVYALLSAPTGTRASITDNRLALRERDRIVVGIPVTVNVVSNSAVIDAPGVYQDRGVLLTVDVLTPNEQVQYEEYHALFDADELVPPFTWRTWQHGDRFEPFGMNGHSMLVSDLLTNLRLPHEARPSIRVLTDRRGILWVCGLRRSLVAPISGSTKRVIRFTQEFIDHDRSSR